MPLQPTYREHAPSADLASHVACFWTARFEPTLQAADVSLTDRVLPDACMDVLFDLSLGDAMLVGAMTRALVVPGGGAINLVGIRFRPGGIGGLFPLPANEVTDGTLPIDVVWGAGARDLARRLPELQDTAHRIALIETELRRRMSVGSGDALVHAVAGMVERARGGVRVDALADAAGLGPRQFERRFLTTVGLSPKMACRVIRFQAAIGCMHAQPSLTLSRVALEAGYHDQAHFNREFRTFAGEPPGEYRRRRGLHDVSVQDGVARTS